MTPLYSPDCELVAWLQPGRFVFDAGMGYAAFITNGHCWSAATGIWLGPAVDHHLFDIYGRPVAWSPASPLRPTNRPLRPVNVVRAVRPVQPVRPVEPGRPLSAPGVSGGWSMLSFREWLIVNDPVPLPAEAQDDAVAATGSPDAPPEPPESNVVK